MDKSNVCSFWHSFGGKIYSLRVSLENKSVCALVFLIPGSHVYKAQVDAVKETIT